MYLLLLLICLANNLLALPDPQQSAADSAQLRLQPWPQAPDPDAVKPGLCGCSAPAPASWVGTGVSLVSGMIPGYDTWYIDGLAWSVCTSGSNHIVPSYGSMLMLLMSGLGAAALPSARVSCATKDSSKKKSSFQPQR